MQGNIKSVNFIKFDYLNRSTEKTALKCNIEFSTQSPIDSTIRERAVFISFSANSDNNVMHLLIQTRIVYSFEGTDMPEERQFLDDYYLHAYDVFRDRVKKTFDALGEDPLPFPDTPVG